MQKYKRGDTRADGNVFWEYRAERNNQERWITKQLYDKKVDKNLSKTSRIKRNLAVIRHKCKQSNIPFDLDFEYLNSIAVDKCPVFGFDLAWDGRRDKIKSNSPSLDRIIPELGYTKGNVQYLSNLANTMKSYATKEQLNAFANWIINDQHH